MNNVIAVIMLCIISMLTHTSSACAQVDLSPIRKHRTEQGAAILQEYSQMLAIPNVAGDTVNIQRNAQFIQKALMQRGVQAELLTLPGASPIVYGKIETPGAKRTLVIYAHYDGQPADATKWAHPPWEPTLYTAKMEDAGQPRPLPDSDEVIDPKWRLYARAAADDKAPIMAALAALDALKATDIALTSNIIFFFEGEEEAGSTHLGEFLEKYRAKLDADAWFFCDGPVHQSRRPQLTFGVRGITTFDITTYGPLHGMHSGHYGNWAPNPAMALARLLSGMKNDDGRVLIKGFYDSVEPLTETEREALKKFPDYDDEMRRELGLARTEADNAPYLERLLLPSLNIRGFVSASVGETARNILPATARASVDVRLVKGNDPLKMLDLVEAHIRRQGYHIVRADPDQETRLAYPKIAKVVRSEGYRAVRTPMSGPIVERLIAAAELAAGEPVVLKLTSGGSLPLYLAEDAFHKPIVMAPIVNHDNNQHSPNENLRLANLWYGIDLMAAIMTMEK